ncbi:reverse transcriptase [Gossypium australe]|uniref:Reverse transcriptase n=1 Tax=Gossypium australe TaxID=47621 RepID=A0A5B6X0B3_9ROSI|nr:reverse transcriptase [Gossypium australe]
MGYLEHPLKKIRFDRDPHFISQFWKKLYEALGTCLDFNMFFHLQSDGQFDREEHLSFAEFAYNNSFQSNILMAPYEALYGHIEFSVGDQVFLKVSLWKKVLRFCRKGKLSPRFI